MKTLLLPSRLVFFGEFTNAFNLPPHPKEADFNDGHARSFWFWCMENLAQRDRRHLAVRKHRTYHVCELRCAGNKAADLLVPVRKSDDSDLITEQWIRKIHRKLRKYEKGDWNGGRIVLKN